MSMETVILGGGIGRFVYRSGHDSTNISGSAKDYCDAIALVFARDNDKPEGTIRFSCKPKTMINCTTNKMHTFSHEKKNYILKGKCIHHCWVEF